MCVMHMPITEERITERQTRQSFRTRRYAEVYAAGMLGVEPKMIKVQIHLTTGLPAFHIVGLGDTAVKESHRRVCAALKNCGFRVPDGVITVNLAPALLNKSGTGFDLAIALGILLADGVLPEQSFDGHIVVGELGLDGLVSNVQGMVGYGMLARKKNKVMVCADTSVFEGLFEVEALSLNHLAQLHSLDIQSSLTKAGLHCGASAKSKPECADFSEVVGQAQAVRTHHSCSGTAQYSYDRTSGNRKDDARLMPSRYFAETRIRRINRDRSHLFGGRSWLQPASKKKTF